MKFGADRGEVDNDWESVAFCRAADLASLIRRSLPRPSGFKPGNVADISLIHYGRNPLAVSGKQRKGIWRTIQCASSRVGHVRQELQLKFPMSQEIPLPLELPDALYFISTSGEEDVSNFWTH